MDGGRNRIGIIFSSDFICRIYSTRTGKTYEEKFYKALGGMPTTIILRFSDDTIDDITKVKYHKWLNEKSLIYNCLNRRKKRI